MFLPALLLSNLHQVFCQVCTKSLCLAFQELVKQREQLQNTEHKLDNIEGDLKDTQKNINGIKVRVLTDVYFIYLYFYIQYNIVPCNPQRDDNSSIIFICSCPYTSSFHFPVMFQVTCYCKFDHILKLQFDGSYFIIFTSNHYFNSLLPSDKTYCISRVCSAVSRHGGQPLNKEHRLPTLRKSLPPSQLVPQTLVIQTEWWKTQTWDLPIKKVKHQLFPLSSHLHTLVCVCVFLYLPSCSIHASQWCSG